MEINNEGFSIKHRFLLIMREVDIIRREFEYQYMNGEIDKVKIEEIHDVYNRVFIGLLREGLVYQYIKDSFDPKKDVVIITIDKVNYECRAITLKNILGDEYETVMSISPDDKEKENFLSRSPIDETVDEEIEEPEIVGVVEPVETEVPVEYQEEYTPEVHEYVEETSKPISSMLYDHWSLHLLEQGAMRGQNVEMYIYPLEYTKNKLNADIVVWAKCGNIIRTFVSTQEQKVVNVDIGDNSFLVRGTIKKGNFETTIVPAKMTLALGININKQKEEIRPNVENFNDGHITYYLGTSKVHVFPICSPLNGYENNENGSADYVVCAELESGARLTIDSYSSNIILVDNGQKNEQILAYWDRDLLKSEHINN